MNKEIKDVIVVGGGAAGMVAAIAAARNGAKVMILEHMDRTGKKILATGNGKCNYTNRAQGVSHYRGECPAFVLPAMEQFGFEETVSFFEELGIYPKEKNGYFYPRSEQASSILQVLQMELVRLKVSIHYEIGIRSIEKKDGLFVFESKSGTFYSKNCILATGGYAAKKTGSDGSGFIYAKKFGHHLAEPVPALVQLIAKQPFEKVMSGVRIQGCVHLFVEKEEIAKSTGEIQLTEQGISGIPTFQISRYASKAKVAGKDVTAIIDFFPGESKQKLQDLLLHRFHQENKKTIEEAFIGLFPDKMITIFLGRAGIDKNLLARNITDEQVIRLCRMIKIFQIKIERPNKFDAAQVTAGGVLTSELHAESMESDLVKGLYFAGEIIDIDGECGGYNLQWAWTSGAVAGTHAAKNKN